MPRYNFLDEAGLKQYHKLAGYSSIPITAITNYTSGVLDLGTGVVTPSTSYMVTDYIVLQQNKKYAILNLSTSRSVICYYKADNTFVFGEVFDSKISFTLQDKTKNGVTPAKIRVSSKGQIFIQALHQNTITWLCNDILENRSDIATNRNDIVETNKTIVRLHADYGFGATPNPIEKDVPTPITIKSAYFQFDKEDVIPTGGVKVTASTKTPTGTVTRTYDISSIINNSGAVSTASISLPTTYTMTITHLGMDLKKSITVNAYYPMYFGSSGNESISKDNLNTIFSAATTIGTAKEVSGVGVFTKQPISGSPSGTRTFKVNSSQYIYLLVPSTMTINKVTSSGFEVPMSSTAPEVAGTNKGSYKVYRSASKVNGGTLSIVIS